MAVLGSIARLKTFHREDVLRLGVAIIIAFGLHLLFFRLLMFKTPQPFEVKEDYIAVELITLPPKAKMPEEKAVEPIIEPPDIEDAPAPPPPKIKPKPIAPPPAEAVTTEAPDILASSRAATSKDAGNTVPLSQGTTPTPAPSPSSTDDNMDKGLKALAAELSCLKGFSQDCADIRKDVFEEFQMTETDKVYTKKYAHTGLPVEFYGLSERQIREKLNLKFAGENGIVLIPGLLALDGNWWDAIHGVNKKCEWKFAAPAKSGAFTRSGELSSAVRHGAIKDCPDYLPAAKEDRDRRNKFKLKANE